MRQVLETRKRLAGERAEKMGSYTSSMWRIRSENNDYQRAWLVMSLHMLLDVYPVHGEGKKIEPRHGRGSPLGTTVITPGRSQRRRFALRWQHAVLRIESACYSTDSIAGRGHTRDCTGILTGPSALLMDFVGMQSALVRVFMRGWLKFEPRTLPRG